MAIKKLRLSFDVPIADLLALVATRNDALHIDVVGDHKPEKLPKQLRNGAVAGLLERPKNTHGGARTKLNANDEHGPISIYDAIAVFLMRAPEYTSSLEIMRPALAQIGVNPRSLSPQLANMSKRGNVKKIGAGTYKLTTHGVNRFEKMMEARKAAKGAQA